MADMHAATGPSRTRFWHKSVWQARTSTTIQCRFGSQLPRTVTPMCWVAGSTMLHLGMAGSVPSSARTVGCGVKKTRGIMTLESYMSAAGQDLCQTAGLLVVKVA